MDNRVERLKNMVYNNRVLLLVSLFLTFTFCVFAPYELYLVNRREFWFRLSLFWWIPFLVGLLATLAIMGIGSLLRQKGLLLYEALLFAAALCLYIQGNFLNLDVGVMNGASIDWFDHLGHFIVDALLLSTIVIAVVLLAVKKREIFEKTALYVSVFVTLVQAVSLGVLLVPVLASGEAGNRNISYASNEGLYEVGEGSNIIVFILDMYDDAYFKEILESEPELKEELEGFTYFSNFTGSYSTTSYSLAHLATGKYCYNEQPALEWVETVAEERLYLDELLEDDYQLYLYSTMTTCFPSRFENAAENYANAPLMISDKLHFTYDLYQLVGLKYFPDFVKPYLWMTGEEFDYWKTVDAPYAPFSVDNLVFKKGLEAEGITTNEADKQIKYIHLNGSHYPYELDENAEQVGQNAVSAVRCARGVLRIVQEYLEELKKNESYDDTAVIITADHGYYESGVLANPVFLVKPQGATGEMVINTAPVCQGDFAATVLELAGLKQNDNYGVSAFEIPEDSQRERYFYQYYLSERTDAGELYRLIEYVMSSETNEPANYKLTDVEYTVDGEKIKHSDYCKTCKGNAPEESEEESEYVKLVHWKDSNYPK